jgi:hypothetical protein
MDRLRLAVAPSWSAMTTAVECSELLRVSSKGACTEPQEGNWQSREPR